MVNQLKRFFPDISCNTVNIRRLIQKGVNNEWTEDMMVEFKTIKSIVTSNACVKPFDPQKKTMIYTDGSKLYGAEYVLTQESGQVDDKDEPIQHLIMCNIITARHEWAGYSLLEVELLALFW